MVLKFTWFIQTLDQGQHMIFDLEYLQILQKNDEVKSLYLTGILAYKLCIFKVFCVFKQKKKPK